MTLFMAIHCTVGVECFAYLHLTACQRFPLEVFLQERTSVLLPFEDCFALQTVNNDLQLVYKY